MVGGEKEEHNRAMGEYDQTYCNHLSLCSCCSGDQLPSPVTQRRAPAPTNGDYEQEKKLVAEITAPGGVKAAPPRDMLASFITRSVNRYWPESTVYMYHVWYSECEA